jgi:hypothetical protein
VQLAEVDDDPGADHDMAVSGTARQQVGQRDRAVGDIDHRMNDALCASPLPSHNSMFASAPRPGSIGQT